MSKKDQYKPGFEGQPNTLKIAANIFLTFLIILLAAAIKVAIKHEWIIFE